MEGRAMSVLATEEIFVAERRTFLELVAVAPEQPELRRSSSDAWLRYGSYGAPAEPQRCVDAPADCKPGRPTHRRAGSGGSAGSGDLWSDVTDQETRAGSDDSRSSISTETEGRTTLMLKNLPSSYLRSDLQLLLDRQGFEGQYDFVHAPVDCFSGAALGYAFVNFLTEAIGDRAAKELQGFSKWNARSRKVMNVCWGDDQGLEYLIERYRNNRMMHPSVPEMYRPLVLRDGQPVDFPAPTKRVLKPRCLPSDTAQRRSSGPATSAACPEAAAPAPRRRR